MQLAGRGLVVLGRRDGRLQCSSPGRRPQRWGCRGMMGTVDTGLAPPVAHIYKPPVDKAVGEVVESLESEASLTVRRLKT